MHNVLLVGMTESSKQVQHQLAHNLTAVALLHSLDDPTQYQSHQV